jgi:hypothetical protein
MEQSRLKSMIDKRDFCNSIEDIKLIGGVDISFVSWMIQNGICLLTMVMTRTKQIRIGPLLHWSCYRFLT